MKKQSGHPRSFENYWPLANASIVISRSSSEIIQLAAGELSRYLYLLTKKISPIVHRLPDSGTSIVLDPKIVKSLNIHIASAELGNQGYRIITTNQRHRRYLVITSLSPVGTLYGVYGLLEELGMGFYAGGDTFPDIHSPALIKANLDISAKPAFNVRGNLLHYNFLCGCTDWGLNDYKFYFDQLSRMRCNMLLMHWYDGEPGAAYEWNGEYKAGGPTPNSLNRPWGAMASLRTSQYSFDTGRYFDDEIYSSPAGVDIPDLLTEIKQTEIMFRNATRYAINAGVEVSAGFEAPRTDPEERSVKQLFTARIRQFIGRNPYITRFALWEHESGGCVGSPVPSAGSPGDLLLQKRKSDFTYLGNQQRVWEAIRFGRFAEIASEVLAKEAPHLSMVVLGWGGDRWMQFADYCLAWDKYLPENVAFTCHDNIDASMGPNVSTPWGQLPPTRERWAMPWVEGDIDECAVRQPNVETLGVLAPDALKKGCQGMLTMQWRTRDVEEETGYIAQYAWDTSLTPDKFYRRLARNAFGPDQEARMGKHLATLQRLGAHWTGVRGTVECGKMCWTGWEPHFPFEVNGEAALYLAKKADDVAIALAEVPTFSDSEAAFHLITDAQTDTSAQQDHLRPGVKELQTAAEQLRQLAQISDVAQLRAEFARIENIIYAIRPKLVAFGMNSRSYHTLDSFLIALHNTHRSAGAKGHMAVLNRMRDDLRKLEQFYIKNNRTYSLERLNYLTSTMDFVLAYDSAAMILANGEKIEQALALATSEKEHGNHEQSTRIAAEAYSQIIDAGMERAAQALTRKLTTKCDFGTLTTFNVKQLQLYWQTFDRLEKLLPASPPRQLSARDKNSEVWISWTPGPGSYRQNLYRRQSTSKAQWQLVNKEPLAGNCLMFIDQPGKTGLYEYAVSAIDKNGLESPKSHSTRVLFDKHNSLPKIVAVKPCTHAKLGEDFIQRVVVVSGKGINKVTLNWRNVHDKGDKWQTVPMWHRFRNSYQGILTKDTIRKGTLAFFVESVDEAGAICLWPQAGKDLPWTITVTD